MKDLKKLDALKVLSIGCGPCTDLLAFNLLNQEGVYSFKTLDYRGIEIDTRIWKKVHEDLEQIAPQNYSIEIINADACEYVDNLLEQNWKPDVIVFQYVFSDMQKHSDKSKIDHLISVMGNYVSQCNNNTYVVCNDINLSRTYGGGREFFDILLQNISCQTKSSQRHFNNSNKRSHFNYGEEYRNNSLASDIPTYLHNYEPYDSCSSAQLIIKKVNE
ncbi:MAG: hypothetical protein IJB16_02175 [Clostridia bacterium]|nr:hypothetical protein [Clostridia bacterium]